MFVLDSSGLIALGIRVFADSLGCKYLGEPTTMASRISPIARDSKKHTRKRMLSIQSPYCFYEARSIVLISLRDLASA